MSKVNFWDVVGFNDIDLRGTKFHEEYPKIKANRTIYRAVEAQLGPPGGTLDEPEVTLLSEKIMRCSSKDLDEIWRRIEKNIPPQYIRTVRNRFMEWRKRVKKT